MRVSNYFLPVLKETPKEAAIASHIYMLRAGMIRQTASGIYSWLPLGLAVLKNIQNIIHEELAKVGCVEMLMPTMQPAELWQESGRGDYGNETLIATDRHNRKLIYGPTHEEIITDIIRKNVHNTKALPLTLYQIQWKFRDEIRPRFGVMRGREFLMKDAYSFTETEAEHIEIYYKMYETYLKIFRRLGLKTIPFKADSGAIGGELSHEFQVIAKTGESEIFYDSKFDELVESDNPDIAAMKELYSAADAKHDADNCPVAEENLKTARGIEVGHIFYLGDKYTKPMEAKITGAGGTESTPLMGCYGIGVSRLVGALVESSHDENGIIWSESVAPFKVGLINICQGDDTCDAMCDNIYEAMQNAGISMLYHNTSERAGAKFGTMDLIGLPWQIIIGKRGAKAGTLELKNRKTGEKQELSLEAVIKKLV